MAVAGENLLGEFLRARRREMLPSDVGLADRGARRVPGLRREVIAMLAGVSPDYYVASSKDARFRPSKSPSRLHELYNSTASRLRTSSIW